MGIVVWFQSPTPMVGVGVLWSRDDGKGSGMRKETAWTVVVTEISDPNRMLGVEFPTFVVPGEARCITTGEDAAYTAAEICSGVWSVPGTYRVLVTAPVGYGPEETGTWKVTVATTCKSIERVV